MFWSANFIIIINLFCVKWGHACVLLQAAVHVLRDLWSDGVASADVDFLVNMSPTQVVSQDKICYVYRSNVLDLTLAFYTF